MFFEQKDTSIYIVPTPMYILMSGHKQDIYITTRSLPHTPQFEHHSTSQLRAMDDWFFVIISVIIVNDSYKVHQKWAHSHYQKEFLKSLDIIQRWQHQRKIP